jgi:HK97 family phage portal protein
MAAWPFTRNRAAETKEHPNGGAFMVNAGTTWGRKDSAEQYIREGYQLNVIVYRAVTEITKAASSIGYELYGANGEAIEAHPVLDLLKRPTPMQTWDAWLTEMLVNRMLMGEMAAVAPNDGVPAELWPLNPLHITVKPGRGGIPSAYVHDVNNRKVSFPVDPITGQSNVLFVKTYNPDNYWRGQSPLMAAALAGDTHNAGMRWNYSLLRNSARPSGLVRFKGGYPSGEIIQRMREYFKARMQGADNAGEIPMLAEDAEWVALSQTARDMDFLSTMKETSKYVAAAMGVPLPLIDNDASTFNNLEQAKERLYTDTVIPILQELIEALNNWLLPRYGDGLELRLDLDTIPALEALRERMFQRAVTAYDKGVLTLQEARELMGYQPEAEGSFKPVPGNPFDLPPDDVKALVYGMGEIETKAESYTPTAEMARAAERALEWRREYGRGGTDVGVARARNIANRDGLSLDTVNRMVSFFARHANNRADHYDPKEPDGGPTAWRIAWDLWGGDAGRDWANRIADREDD